MRRIDLPGVTITVSADFSRLRRAVLLRVVPTFARFSELLRRARDLAGERVLRTASLLRRPTLSRVRFPESPKGGGKEAGPRKSEAARKTISDLRFYFPVIAMQGIMGLVSAALATKLFPPQEYGKYVLAFTLYSQLTLFTSLWLQFAIIRFAPHYRSKGAFDDFASTVLFSEVALTCCLGLFLPFLLSLFVRGTDPHLFYLLTAALVGALVLPFVGAMEQLYRIEDRPGIYCSMVLFRILCGPAIGLLLAKGFHLGMAGFFSGTVSPHLFVFLLLLYLKRERVLYLLRRRVVSLKILKEILLYSGPGVGLAIVASSLVLSDRYLVAWNAGAYALAVYTIAYTVANQGMELISTVLLGAGEPIAYRMWEKQGPAEAHRYVGQLLRYFSLFAFPAVVGLAVLGRRIIPILSTRAYVEGWPVVGYVALGVLFCGYSQILSRLFFFRKRTLTPFFLYLAAAGVNVLLDVILIPRFGYIAAAWSTLAAYFLLFLAVFLFSMPFPSTGFSYRLCFRMAGGALFMGGLIYAIRDIFASAWLSVAVCLPVGAASYLFALIVTREIDAKQVSRLLLHLPFLSPAAPAAGKRQGGASYEDRDSGNQRGRLRILG